MSVLLKVLAICVLFIDPSTEYHTSNTGGVNPTLQSFIPCTKGDVQCHKVSSQLVYQDLVIKTSDPVKHKEISGKYNDYRYNFTGVTTTGLKNCVVNSIMLNSKMIMELELLCVNLTITGKYDVRGNLGGKKINDASKFVTRTSTYLLGVIAKVDQIKGRDGKKHMKLVNIVTHSSALARIRLNLDNRCDLENFLNSNWKLTSTVLDHSVMDTLIKHLAKIANDFLMKTPVDDMHIKEKHALCVPDKDKKKKKCQVCKK